MIIKRRYKGTIKFFSYERGYGFLIPHDENIKEDVFFHFSSISTQPGMIVYLIPKQVCEFELVKGPRGFLAKNVTSAPNESFCECPSDKTVGSSVNKEKNIINKDQSDEKVTSAKKDEITPCTTCKNMNNKNKTKQNDIFHHYYHSFRKIMDKMIEEEIEKMNDQ